MPTKDRLDLLQSLEKAGPDFSGFRNLRRVWKGLPIPTAVRGALTTALYRSSRKAQDMLALEEELEPVLDFHPLPPKWIKRGPLIVSGYLSDVSGIGRGGRMSLEAFRAAGLKPVPHDLRRNPDGWQPASEGGVWFSHCNAPEGDVFLQNSSSPYKCYRVGYWAWELPRLPSSWAETAKLFHEIWVPSRFVADSFKSATPEVQIPVRVVPHPHPDMSSVTADRLRFGFKEGVFTFLSMYDVLSSATRKNPMGAVTAFQKAFDKSDATVELVVKIVSADKNRTTVDELAARVAGWPNIRLMPQELTDQDANALLASADAFVSLHRSEGFGLSIAQAMALGRPVIVTGWSGNMDFCDAGAALTPFQLVPVSDPTGTYVAPDQVWADPDLDAAARLMRGFVEDPEQARRLGATARDHIAKRLPRAYDVRPLKRWIHRG